MARTRSQPEIEEGSNNGPDIREMVSSEVGRTLQEVLPGMFEQIKEDIRAELRQIVTAEIRKGAGSSTQAPSRSYNYRDFAACQPPLYEGKRDPVISTRWLSEVNGAFSTTFCPEDAKVRYAANLLRGPAKDWWNLMIKIRTQAEVDKMSWDVFQELFKKQFAPSIEMGNLATKFLALEQKDETVNEITDKFLELSLFCPGYVADEEMKMSHYTKILKTEIREFVVTARCKTLEEMIEVARLRELELETQARKRKQTSSQKPPPSKKLKYSETKTEHQVNPECKICGKRHPGECRYKDKTCYKCGKSGHPSDRCK